MRNGMLAALAALAMGASRTQAVSGHVLPLAMPGVMTGAIISLAHALGETAPPVTGAPTAACVRPARQATPPATVTAVRPAAAAVARAASVTVARAPPAGPTRQHP